MVANQQLSEGTNVRLAIYSLQRDGRYFYNPDKFHPESECTLSSCQSDTSHGVTGWTARSVDDPYFVAEKSAFIPL